jgi:bifunctional non-homologous end joining protein LigD
MAPAHSKYSRLGAYHAKRRAEGTSEPMGARTPATSATERLFVVQKHSARRLHYDLRLEFEGTLLSWAVPRGFSLDPAEKRMAVQVEDHPVEYADYEGVIPEGNYGAGPSILWDRGRWIALEPPAEGLEKGKLLFELIGYKLRGVWTLVRTKKSGQTEPSKDWLLIKKPDAWARTEPATFPEESIISGLKVEELPEARAKADAIRAELLEAGAKERAVPLAGVKVMLAELGDQPFSHRDWIFELKWDGYRLVAAQEGARARLCYRRGNDATSLFPEIAKAVEALPYRGLVIDGEVVVSDDEGRPVFQRLQKRSQLQRAADVTRAALEYPATYYAFDLLAFDGLDLRGLPLVTRKAALHKLLPSRGPIRFADHIAGDGEALWAEVTTRGLEGMVAKKAASIYRGGRWSDWLKLRIAHTGDFAVVGLSPPEGARVGFGALHLAGYENGELVYVGRVGSGFTHKQLESLSKRLLADRRPQPPCGGPLPGGRGHIWVEPRLAVEVRYTEWTEEALLRQPVFLRLREDKPLAECTLPRARGPATADEADTPPVTAEPAPDPAARQVRFTNLGKVYWPEEGYTKSDMIEYYRAVAPVLLPYLKDRPVVLTRYPDGIHGKSFFQVNAPDFTPGWVRTERFYNEDAQKDVDVYVCDDVETLLFLANCGSIPLHLWGSRVGTLARPDWCILDLDPKVAPFADVIEIARCAHDLCRGLRLPLFPKTSGQSGLHLLIPLAGLCTYEQCRGLAQLLATTIVQELPEKATLVRAPIEARGGKVYIDWLQNGHGRLMASPYCLRPRPGAPVSTPLLWKEVGPGLDPMQFTLKTVPPRLARLKKDPMIGVLTEAPDLLGALGRLEARVKKASRKADA